MRSAYKMVIGSLAILFLSIFSFIYVLPYKMSHQNPIDDSALSGSYNFDNENGIFHGKSVRSPRPDTREFAGILGEEDNRSHKQIEVDLTNQRLYAFDGDKKVFDFLVSTGKWGKTPTGEFDIWIKLKATTMSGGNRALGTYYYLPNVPYTMYFYNKKIPARRGYGIHGTYWHNNFGHPMSHGCINLRTEDAEKLYYWANPELKGKSSIRATKDNPGTKIIIYGKTPRN